LRWPNRLGRCATWRRRPEGILEAITESGLRANLAEVFDAIENDSEDLVVTRSWHEPLGAISPLC